MVIVSRSDLDRVELVVPKAVDERGALAQRLARDGAPVHPHAADDVLPLDERDTFSSTRRLDGGALAARTAAGRPHRLIRVSRRSW
jgi:hypothetical protein